MSCVAIRRALIPRRHPWKCQTCRPTVLSRRVLWTSSFGGDSKRHNDNTRPANLVRFLKQASSSSRGRSRPGHDGGDQTTPRDKQSGLGDLQSWVAGVERVARLFVAQLGVPSEETTLTALRVCARADVKKITDHLQQEKPVPVTSRPPSQSQTTASHLLDLAGSSRTGGSAVSATPHAENAQNMVDRVSEAAYAIVTHPTVVITPQVLDEYVKIQARLGKPETLSRVLALCATKPRPRRVSDQLAFVVPKPGKMEHAVSAATAECALDAAIEARNLDAAIGIIENTYAAPAFRKSKLVRNALVPASLFAAVPIAAFQVAATLSHLQVSMDPDTARNIAFAGIMAYIGFTATIGVVVITTANDQMKRVTWTPGIPLRERWLREDERAALDRLACAFGFSEPHRWGEEQGSEFKSLREYLLLRGMVLDAVELMEGMT